MKRYQAVAFLLSTAMTVTAVAPVFGAANDISGHWAQATITKWQDAGRIGGYEDGTFKPDRTITRAEFVRLLNTATSTSFTSNASVNFSDVKESDWFYADVAKAVGAKITSGFEDGTFRPSETVTRMQAAVFICNAKGLAANEAGANLLTDAAQIPAWAKGAVGAVISAGYMSGYPDGSFGGAKGMTRAEAVSTLDRVLGGGVTTPAPDNQGVSTPDTNQDTTIADAKQEGNMVWKSGGGGGSSSKGSSSSGSENEDNIVKDDITINNQRQADKLEGKTIQGDVTINLNSDLNLEDVKFEGNVTVNSGTVAAAYIGNDTAVAAANTTKWTILLVGTTSFDGEVTVTSDKTDAPFVEIKTLSRKSISNFIARTAARIVGFTTAKVQASAPVQVADGKVESVTAESGAEIIVEKDAEVATVAVTGDAKVTVQDGASVENVAVSGSAKAEIAVEGTANVGEVAISDSATATVDVAEGATVTTITVTSDNEEAAIITGDGEINKIEATNPDAVDTKGATNAPKVDKIEKPGEDETEKTEVKASSVSPDDKTLTEGTIGEKTYAFTVEGASAIKADNITVEPTVEVKGLTGAATTEGNKVTVTFTATDEVAAGTNEFTVTIPAADITADDTHKVSADVTAKISVVVDKAGTEEIEKIQLQASAFSIVADGITKVVLKADVMPEGANQSVTWEAVAYDQKSDIEDSVEGNIVEEKEDTYTFDETKAELIVAKNSPVKSIKITATSTVDKTKFASIIIPVTETATDEDITKALAALENVIVSEVDGKGIAAEYATDESLIRGMIISAAEDAIQAADLSDKEGWLVGVKFGDNYTFPTNGLETGTDAENPKENRIPVKYTVTKGGVVVTGGENLEKTVIVKVAAKDGGSEVTSGITDITATDKDNEEITITSDAITMEAPAEATTIKLTAALEGAEAGATVAWTITDTDTTGVKIDNGADSSTAVTHTLSAEGLNSDEITLNIPANIDVSAADKSLSVEVTYAGKATEEAKASSVVATKTLTITFTKANTDAAEAYVKEKVTGTYKIEKATTPTATATGTISMLDGSPIATTVTGTELADAFQAVDTTAEGNEISGANVIVSRENAAVTDGTIAPDDVLQVIIPIGNTNATKVAATYTLNIATTPSETVDTVTITGLIAPADGVAPVEKDAVSAGADVTVDSVTWQKKDLTQENSQYEDNGTTNFAEGNQYKAVVTISTTKAFPDSLASKITANGGTVTITSEPNADSNDNKKCVFEVEFPALKAEISAVTATTDLGSQTIKVGEAAPTITVTPEQVSSADVFETVGDVTWKAEDIENNNFKTGVNSTGTTLTFTLTLKDAYKFADNLEEITVDSKTLSASDGNDGSIVIDKTAGTITVTLKVSVAAAN